MSTEKGRGSAPDPAGGRSDSSAARYAGVGLQFVASLLLFLFVGQWLDRRLGTTPWLTITGVFVGAGAAFYSMYRQLMGDLAREEEARRK